jgi:hypothetical protein
MLKHSLVALLSILSLLISTHGTYRVSAQQPQYTYQLIEACANKSSLKSGG